MTRRPFLKQAHILYACRVSGTFATIRKSAWEHSGTTTYIFVDEELSVVNSIGTYSMRCVNHQVGHELYYNA